MLSEGSMHTPSIVELRKVDEYFRLVWVSYRRRKVTESSLLASGQILSAVTNNNAVR